MAIPGAPAALKGYRLQHLYILHRLLRDPAANNLAFQLEGSEDLDLFDPHTGELIESVQIKAYEGKPITASDLFSKDDSFFHRAEHRLREHPNSVQKVIGFGSFGPTLKGAVAGCTPDLEVTCKYLQTKGFSAGSGRRIIASTRLETVSEEMLERETLDALAETLAGADPQTTFLFLGGWMLRASEQRERITRDTVHNRLQAIGNLANENAFERLNWGSTIRPIVDEEGPSAKSVADLREEFFRGTYTSMAHIQAELDIPRPAVLNKIDALLSQSSAVVVHGASGEGKTSLAYRYLLDRARGAWRFEIKHIEDGVHALQLSRVLAKHARAIGVRLLVYIDVPPLNTAWRIVVRDLSDVGNIKILVTLREDDWNRARLDGMQFDAADLRLSLSETEAEGIYSAIARAYPIPRWIDFTDAWVHFGGRGPLMEFTYLLTQSESLQNRLTTQTRVLREQVRLGRISSAELELLRNVAVASAFGARLDLRRVGARLCLSDPGQTVAMFEREYLLRVDEHGRYLLGLHPIRSEILTNILTDEGAGPSWAETARSCLSSMEETDIEGFLIAALLERPLHAHALFQQLSDFTPHSWKARAGIVHALLAKGVQEYVSDHAQALTQAQSMFGAGWWIVVPFDLTGIRSGIEWPSPTPFERDDVKALIARFDDPKRVMAHAKSWLSVKTLDDLVTINIDELGSLSEVVFWRNYLGVPGENLSLQNLVQVSTSSSLEVLLDLLGCCSVGSAAEDIAELRDVAMAKFRQEHLVLSVDAVDGSIRCHYIYSLEELRRGRAGNDVAMARVNALQCLAPAKEKYGATGYGHAISGPLSYDPAYKDGVPRSALPSRRLVQVNSAFMALAERILPRESWQTYVESVVRLRREVIAGLDMLCQFVMVYFPSQQVQKPQDLGFDFEQWFGVAEALKMDLQMPRLGIPLGTPATLEELADQRERVSVLNCHDVRIRKYFRSLRSFFMQVPSAIFANMYAGRAVPRPSDAGVAQWLRENSLVEVRHISASNLLDAHNALAEAQQGFTAVLSRMPELTSAAHPEGEEETLARAVKLWFLMVNSPVLRTTDALGVAARKFSLPLDRLRTDLARQFADAHSDGQVIYLLDKVAVDDERAWVVGVDVSSAGEMGAAFLKVLDITRRTVTSHLANKMLLILLRSEAHYIFVVPTVKGRAVARIGWKLLSTMLPPEPTTDSVPSSQMQCQLIDDHLWSQIGLPERAPSLGEPMLQLFKDVRGLHEVVRHVCEIARSPSDGLGHRIRDEYWGRIWPELTQGRDRVADSLSHAKEGFQTIDDDDDVIDNLSEMLAFPREVSVAGFPDACVLEVWERNQQAALTTCEQLWMFWCTLGVQKASHS